MARWSRRANRRHGAAIVCSLVFLALSLAPASPADAAHPDPGSPGGFGPPRTVAAMVAPGAPQAVPGDALTGARAVLVALHDPPEHYGRWWVTAVVRGSTTFIAYDRYPEGVGGEPQQHRWDAIAAEVSALVLGAETRSYPRRGVTAPGWTAHNTGRIHGPSASLVLSLALIDGQVPGRLGGALDVAATGRVTSFGTVDRVAGIDAKFAVAHLAGADVFFAPRAPRELSGELRPDVVHHTTAWAAPDDPLAPALRLDRYAADGRADRSRPGTRVVVVDDVRQALAYLCGRTGATACDVLDAEPVRVVADAERHASTLDVRSAVTISVGAEQVSPRPHPLAASG